MFIEVIKNECNCIFFKDYIGNNFVSINTELEPGYYSASIEKINDGTFKIYNPEKIGNLWKNKEGKNE